MQAILDANFATLILLLLKLLLAGMVAVIAVGTLFLIFSFIVKFIENTMKKGRE